MTSPQPEKRIRVTEPGDFDILCGKDKRAVHHSGSRRFREIIETYKERYQASVTKYEKMVITKSIYDNLMQLGYCFLKFNKREGVWEGVLAVHARDKIGHALRFANRDRAKKQQSTNNDTSTTVTGGKTSEHSDRTETTGSEPPRKRWRTSQPPTMDSSDTAFFQQTLPGCFREQASQRRVASGRNGSIYDTNGRPCYYSGSVSDGGLRSVPEQATNRAHHSLYADMARSDFDPPSPPKAHHAHSSGTLNNFKNHNHHRKVHETEEERKRSPVPQEGQKSSDIELMMNQPMIEWGQSVNESAYFDVYPSSPPVQPTVFFNSTDEQNGEENESKNPASPPRGATILDQPAEFSPQPL